MGIGTSTESDCGLRTANCELNVERPGCHPQSAIRNPHSAIGLDQPHLLLDIAHRLASERAAAVSARGKHFADSMWIRPQLTGALVDWRELARDSLEQHLLAVDAPP